MALSGRSQEVPGGWALIKNTFLDWPSPWQDSEFRMQIEANEANRPSSDPTTSSRSSSVNSFMSESGESDTWRRGVRPREQQRGPGVLSVSDGHAKAPDVMVENASKATSAIPTRAALGVASSVQIPRGSRGHATGVASSVQIPRGSRGHATGQCTPCMNFLNGHCRAGPECARCHLPHDKKGKKKRMRPPPRYRNGYLPKSAQEATVFTELQPEGEKQRDGKDLRKFIEEIMKQAVQDGDSFNIDRAHYVPEFVKESTSLREMLLTTLDAYRHSRGMTQPPPAVSGPRATATSSGWHAQSPNPNVRFLRPPQKIDPDDDSANNIFSL